MLNEKERQEILEKFRNSPNFGKRAVLEEIPEGERRYKCHTCYTIVDKKPCPVCGEKFLEIMCPLDHCECKDVDPIPTHAYCPLCGEAVCPACQTHSVLAISRVTGLTV